MKDWVSRVFGVDKDAPQERGEDDIRVATCALFLEIANIDSEFSEEERRRILTIMQETYGLSATDATEIARRAASELRDSVDLWKFTNLINERYTEEEKEKVVELLWSVVYADGVLEAHEDYLVHKLSRLLRLQHKQLIAAKLRVLHEK